MPSGIYYHKKGFRHSEETKVKMREKRLKSISEGRGYIFKKGQLFSDEHKNKISKAKQGNRIFLGRHHTNETIKKMSMAHMGKKPMLGKHLSKDTRRKISVAHIGMKHTEETKRKLSKIFMGEKSYFWNGGISYEPYSVDWTRTLKRAIRERDKYTCQICSNEGNIVHHIDYNKKNCNPINLITLCKKCHSQTNVNRKQWLEYFKDKLK